MVHDALTGWAHNLDMRTKLPSLIPLPSLSSRATALLMVVSLALMSCGAGDPTVARIRADVLDGAAAGDVTYTINGETSTVAVTPGADLDLDVELNGSFSIEVAIVNTSAEGVVRCGFSDLVPGGSSTRGTQDATCRASGSVRGGSLEVSFDNESNDGPKRVEVEGVLSVTVPPEFELLERIREGVLLEMTSPAGDIFITTEPLDPDATTAVEFGELFGSDTEPAVVGEFDGAFSNYRRAALSSFTVLRDEDMLFVSTNTFPFDGRRALLTSLVESLNIAE